MIMNLYQFMTSKEFNTKSNHNKGKRGYQQNKMKDGKIKAIQFKLKSWIVYLPESFERVHQEEAFMYAISKRSKQPMIYHERLFGSFQTKFLPNELLAHFPRVVQLLHSSWNLLKKPPRIFSKICTKNPSQIKLFKQIFPTLGGIFTEDDSAGDILYSVNSKQMEGERQLLGSLCCITEDTFKFPTIMIQTRIFTLFELQTSKWLCRVISPMGRKGIIL